MERQSYAMYAQTMMTSDLLPVRPEDSAERVLALMDEYKVRHLPLVNGEEFKGLIYEDDLMEVDGEAPMAALEARPVAVDAGAHVYDVVSAIVLAEVDVMPVIASGRYLGVVRPEQVLRFLSTKAGWGRPGGVIVLNRVPPRGRLTGEMTQAIKEFGGDIAKSTLGNRILYASCLGEGLTAMEKARTSKAALEVEALAKEIAARL